MTITLLIDFHGWKNIHFFNCNKESKIISIKKRRSTMIEAFIDRLLHVFRSIRREREKCSSRTWLRYTRYRLEVKFRQISKNSSNLDVIQISEKWTWNNNKKLLNVYHEHYHPRISRRKMISYSFDFSSHIWYFLLKNSKIIHSKNIHFLKMIIDTFYSPQTYFSLELEKNKLISRKTIRYWHIFSLVI